MEEVDMKERSWRSTFMFGKHPRSWPPANRPSTASLLKFRCYRIQAARGSGPGGVTYSLRVWQRICMAKQMVQQNLLGSGLLVVGPLLELRHWFIATARTGGHLG